MEHPRRVVLSHRYSPVDDYAYDARHVVASTRQPLRESTGNAQPDGLSGLPLCHGSELALSASLPSTILTPVLPPQVPGPSFATGVSSRGHQLRLAQRGFRHGINPIYLSPQFAQYRDKQDQKEKDEEQKWPPVLEDAFLDALLLVPNMGRKKYNMRGKLYGRNMLISEYLWIAYCISLPPDVRPDEGMRRGRKQVSSHIQVLKNFFLHHRCYHFFFGSKEDDKKDKEKDYPVELENLRSNTVLQAISEGRLPEECPNYEYFGKLLQSDSLVAIRPKTAWIFVSSPDVILAEGGTAHDRNSGKILEPELYPHLPKNFEREEDLIRRLNGSVLLHEYTRNVVQKEASAVKEISHDWATKMPTLFDALERCTQEGECDIIEMKVTLELAALFPFPPGAQLNAFIELSIAQPALQSHRWKCLVRLVRPRELCGDVESQLVEQTNEVPVQHTHLRGCSETDSCDCTKRPRQDVRVPFPAAEWASILANCAAYGDGADSAREAKGRSRRRDVGNVRGREPTAGELLLDQVAMIQELWSSPPELLDQRSWTRRGVIIWRFQTPYQGFDEKGKPIIVPSGTNWRFLTTLDPSSQYHQQHAYVSPNAAKREPILSPPPTYQHQLAGTMNENFHSPWDPVVTLPSHVANLTSAPGALNILTYHHGLTTPPPTATAPAPANLHSCPGFDYAQDIGSTHTTLPYLSAVSTCGSMPLPESPSNLAAAVRTTAGADPFLTATAGLKVAPVDESRCDASLQTWDAATSFPGLESWAPSSYSQSSSWASSQSTPAPSHWHDANKAAINANRHLFAVGRDNEWSRECWSQVSSVAGVGPDGKAGWTYELESPSRVLGVEDGDRGGAATGAHLGASHQGIKRSRAESLDLSNRELFPSTAIPKLLHHAPVARMER